MDKSGQKNPKTGHRLGLADATDSPDRTTPDNSNPIQDGIKQVRQHNRHITAITSVYDSPDLDPELAEIVAAWSTISKPDRARLASLARSMKRKRGKP